MAEVIEVAVQDLVAREDQPRQYYDAEKITQLADSMRSQGWIGQVTVRRVNGHYELLAGHRRRLAAIEAGLSTVSAVVVDLTDEAAREFLLLDNLNREDFLPWEEGVGFNQLVGVGLSVERIAEKAGRSVSYVSGRIVLEQEAGEKLRAAFLGREVNLAGLLLLSKLPCWRLSPILCPRCKVVNREGSEVCAACREDLTQEFVVPAPGNPQEAATRLAWGKSVDGVQQIIEKVKQAYGLSAVPVQTSLGFSDRQLSAGAVKLKGKLQQRLGEIADLGSWHLDTLDEKAREYTADQQAAILAQFQAARKVLAGVEDNFRAAVGGRTNVS